MKNLVFYLTEKVEGQGIRRTGSRKVEDIAKDLRKLLDKHKMPYEYVSTTHTSLREWPIGNSQVDYCWLEPGGNEGWSIFLATRYCLGRDESYRWVLHEPIRIKLLCVDDDAWRVVRFVREHLDCW